MSSILRTILFKETPIPTTTGRPIRFDVSDIDIRFSTGTMHERVLGYMTACGEPLTAKDIAQGIGSTTSRVYQQLKRLVADGKIELIRVVGFHPEYSLTMRKKERN